MTLVWLSLWLSLPPAPVYFDDQRWKLRELHNPFPEADRPAPLPPEDELKLRELKPLPVERNR